MYILFSHLANDNNNINFKNSDDHDDDNDA